MVRTIRKPNFSKWPLQPRWFYIKVKNLSVYKMVQTNHCSVFKWSTIRKRIFKTFGIRMFSVFECSEFEPPLYIKYPPLISLNNSQISTWEPKPQYSCKFAASRKLLGPIIRLWGTTVFYRLEDLQNKTDTKLLILYLSLYNIMPQKEQR